MNPARQRANDNVTGVECLVRGHALKPRIGQFDEPLIFKLKGLHRPNWHTRLKYGWLAMSGCIGTFVVNTPEDQAAAAAPSLSSVRHALDDSGEETRHISRESNGL